MGVRSYLGNWFMNFGRSIARKAGYELQVTLDEHQIKLKMVKPDKENTAWDQHLYRNGNVFMAGYANPIKPVVDHNKELEDPDRIGLEEGESTIDDEQEPENVDVEETDSHDTHAAMISSPRYQEFMRQDLIEQLLNPAEKWKMIIIGILGIGALQLLTMALAASAAGLI